MSATTMPVAAKHARSPPPGRERPSGRAGHPAGSRNSVVVHDRDRRRAAAAECPAGGRARRTLNWRFRSPSHSGLWPSQRSSCAQASASPGARRSSATIQSFARSNFIEGQKRPRNKASTQQSCSRALLSLKIQPNSPQPRNSSNVSYFGPKTGPGARTGCRVRSANVCRKAGTEDEPTGKVSLRRGSRHCAQHASGHSRVRAQEEELRAWEQLHE
jgi:hypothetical protein